MLWTVTLLGKSKTAELLPRVREIYLRRTEADKARVYTRKPFRRMD
jgi:hypothetical protein